MSMQGWLDQLNPEQREAVMINEGSLLVFAGAGSGKTRVITTKIAYAIEELGVDPYHILAVTFTNKACKEMQDRVIGMVGEEGQRVMIKTFHSFGVWLLRKYGDRVGWSLTSRSTTMTTAWLFCARPFRMTTRRRLPPTTRRLLF